MHTEEQPSLKPEVLKPELPQPWFFTFGFNSSFRNCYVRVVGTYSEARAKMFETYGKRWAFQYSAMQFMSQIQRFDLREVDFGTEVFYED